jgi:DNA-binding MarR family transcriptional regulator
VQELEQVGRELGLLVRSLKGLHHEVLAEVGVRVELPAMALLTVVSERGPSRPSTLAEALHLDLSSVSRQVAALEREAWLSRERDPADFRAALVDLTPAGREVLVAVRAASVRHLRRLLPDWSDADLDQFGDQLRRFRVDLTRDPGSHAADHPIGEHADIDRPHTHHTPSLVGQES